MLTRKEIEEIRAKYNADIAKFNLDLAEYNKALAPAMRELQQSGDHLLGNGAVTHARLKALEEGKTFPLPPMKPQLPEALETT